MIKNIEFLLCGLFIILNTGVLFASNGIKLYEEFVKFLGKEDAFGQVFGLKPLKEHTDPMLRQNQYGFQAGLWGSELLPTNFWFLNTSIFTLKSSHLHDPNAKALLSQVLDKDFSWILSSVESVLINMNWMKLTKLCNEIKFPRCSWKYFINIADPFGLDYQLLKSINHNLVSIITTPSGYPELNLIRFFVPVVLDDCYPIKSVDQMSAIYIYSVCLMYSEFLDSDSMRICPDPCRDFPCQSIRNADVTSCKRLGIYKRDFTCSCLQGYRWDSKSLACLAENYCFSVCDKKGTMKCNFSPNLGTVECVCKSGYMAFDCSLLNNACIFGDNHPSHISGLEACNVAEGKNKCYPLLGTAAYSCGCTPPFVADRNLPYDNCLAVLEQCANRLCVFGSCETSPDGYRSYCQCDLDFKGEECDIPRGQWSSWSNWTTCFPNCGNESISQRIRYCIGQIDDCIGSPEEIKNCHAKPCFYDRPAEDITYDIFWDNWIILTIISVTYLILIVLVSSILTLFRSQRKKMNNEEYKKQRKLNLAKSIHKIKRRYGHSLDATNVMDTLDEIWNPDADDEEMKINLNVIYKILMKLKKKNPKIFQIVTERSEVAALALSYNQEKTHND